MNKPALSVTVAALLACGMLSAPTFADHHAAAEPASVQVDLSEPKATVKSMLQAASKGDAAAFAKTIDTRDPQVKEMLDILSPMVVAAAEFGLATMEKFGQSANAGPMDMATLAKLIDGAEVTIDGDTAVVEVVNVPEEFEGKVDLAELRPMSLVQVDGEWYIDPISMEMDPAEFAGPQAEQAKKVIPAMTKAVKDVTASVKAGEYESLAQAEEALQARMMQVMMQAMQGGMGE